MIRDAVDVELHDEVVDWMDTLDDDEWHRTVVVIERFAALGATARMPRSKSLSDGLFELRFTLGPTARRITYRFTKDGRAVLLTTFRKQRNNERAEVARARKGCRRLRSRESMKEETMANYSAGTTSRIGAEPRPPRRGPVSSRTSRWVSSSTTCGQRQGSASVNWPSAWVPRSR